MGMPAVMKHFNVFQNGVSYRGKAEEVTPPKLTRKMEEWRGAGMLGPIQLDMGMEGMELEWSVGGIDKDMLTQFGAITADSIMLRFAGAAQNDDTGDWVAVEIVVHGRQKELDFGSFKPGDKTTVKATMPLTYYKLSIDGEDVIEIDLINFIAVMGGKDVLAEVRRILGI
jgi:uncharacterized protein